MLGSLVGIGWGKSPLAPLSLSLQALDNLRSLYSTFNINLRIQSYLKVTLLYVVKFVPVPNKMAYVEEYQVLFKKEKILVILKSPNIVHRSYYLLLIEQFRIQRIVSAIKSEGDSLIDHFIRVYKRLKFKFRI